MSVTYGFYNSLNHDRKYDATQLSEIFDGIIHDGVYELLRRDDGTITKKFMVEATGTGFQVTVDEGRAWFYHTWTKNDAKIVINLPSAPTVVNKYRYDAIILDIDANTNVRENKITYVSGPEGNSQTPTKPELINSGLRHQIPLAYVLRVGRETVINQSNITIAVGSSECPYVAGAIDFIDISNHIKQFQAAWDEWFAGFTTTNVDSFENWKEQQQEIYNRWLADLQRWTTQKQSVFEGWMETEQESFESWFENLQYILDGDVAGHLLMEIDRLAERITPIEYGGTGNDNGYIQTGNIMGNYPERYSEPGDYATAEGMFTSAPGIASHAEGGGQFVATFHEAGFITDGEFGTFPNNPNRTIEDTGTEESVQGYYGKSLITSSSVITSIYLAYILKNETTGDILTKKVGAIGSASKDSRNYIGNLIDGVTNVNVKYDNSSSRFKDIGVFPMDFKNGYGSSVSYFYTESKPVLPESFFYVDIPYSYNTSYGEDHYTSSDNIYLAFKQNAKSAWAINTVTRELIGTYSNEEGLTSGSLNFEKGYNFWTTHLYNVKAGLERDGSSWILSYMNTNPKKETVRIYFSTETISQPDVTDDAISMSGGDIGFYISENGKNAYLSTPQYLNVYGNTQGDTYSLSFYYTYSTENDVDYPIEWQPAGYIKTGIGYPTRAIGRYSHAEGHRTKAYGLASHAEGYVYDTSGEESDLPGAYGEGSHCEGKDTYARGDYSHAEGEGNKALGLGSHAEGKETTADGSYSHVEGFSTHTVDYSGTNKGNYAHAEGESTRAYGQGSHAEGCINFAGGAYSHAEGINCNAYGMASHSEGYQAIATSGSDYAHAGGKGGVAHILGQFVHGHFGFGGTAQEFINTDGTVTFPDTIPGFNGGSFYFKNTESTAKTVHVDLMYNKSDGTGKIEGLMATWLIIKRDVPVTGVSNIASHACVWLATVKNNTGGIQLHEIYRSDDTELACSVSPDGNGVKFTVKGSGSNNGLAAAAQIIRIM